MEAQIRGLYLMAGRRKGARGGFERGETARLEKPVLTRVSRAQRNSLMSLYWL